MKKQNKNTNYAKHKKIVSLYQTYNNAAEVARRLKVSRQWIVVVLNKEGIATARPLYKRCRMCNREFNEELKHKTGGLCGGCQSYISYHKKDIKRGYYRHVTYPPNCMKCKKPFLKGDKKSKGMCEKCYRSDAYSLKHKKMIPSKILSSINL